MTRLLVIDDDNVFLEGIKLLLERRGFSLTVALDGTEAFNIAKQQKFDVVITDVLMEKTHGAEVIRHMKEFYPETRVIAMSGGGWSPPEFHLNAIKVFGADACLIKPFPIENLIREINRVLKS
jgi:CheY-like chemotaxis protein